VNPRGARWPVRCVIATVLAVLLTSWSLWRALPGDARGPWSFSHAAHLTPQTLAAARAGPGTPGSDAECIVCHDFAATGDVHVVERERSCNTCHLGDDHLELELAKPPAATRPAFPHRSHVKDPAIGCFTCHRVREDRGAVWFSIPPRGLGARGAGGAPGGPDGAFTCADCHAEHRPTAGVKQDDVTGDGKRCSECHGDAALILPLQHRGRTRPSAARSFRHADHGGAVADCATCHASMAKSRTVWDSRPVDVAPDTCRGCHVGADFVTRESVVPFVQFERFSHVEHLTPAGKVKTAHEGTPTCATCHFPKTGASASAEPVGRGGMLDFDGCVTCHESWRVEGHGVGSWACFKCHVGEVAEDGKLPMARASVSRGRIDAVGFLSAHHPEITTRGPRLRDGRETSTGKRCIDCHVGGREALDSRLAGRSFAHGPHLSESPSANDCLACHSSALDARWSQDLIRFDTHLTAAPAPTADRIEARGCRECHLGPDAQALQIGVAEREVPQFDHAGHVHGAPWNGAKGIECTECHVAGGDAGYTTAGDVLDCTRCHAHDEKQPEKRARTGPSVPEGTAQSCAFCHSTIGAAGGTVPAPTNAASRRREHAALVSGTQFHDRTGDCAACHARAASPAAPPQERAWVVRAKVRVSIHDDPRYRDRWFNDPTIDKTPDALGRTCSTCHRREPESYLRGFGK
jgi:decaheme cytochrome c component MtrC/MtrF-like protein